MVLHLHVRGFLDSRVNTACLFAWFGRACQVRKMELDFYLLVFERISPCRRDLFWVIGPSSRSVDVECEADVDAGRTSRHEKPVQKFSPVLFATVPWVCAPRFSVVKSPHEPQGISRLGLQQAIRWSPTQPSPFFQPSRPPRQLQHPDPTPSPGPSLRCWQVLPPQPSRRARCGRPRRAVRRPLVPRPVRTCPVTTDGTGGSDPGVRHLPCDVGWKPSDHEKATRTFGLSLSLSLYIYIYI